MKILAVDDNKDVLALVKIWLEKKGHKVITAIDGADALTKLTKDLEVIFLDIMMPGLTPHEIVDEIKIKSPKADVIHLTSVVAFDLTQEQTNSGRKPVLEPPVIGYIEKPVNEESFLANFDRILKNADRFKKAFKKK